MAATAKQLYLSVERYLYSVERYLYEEADWPTRREYVDGQVYDMAGASSAHNLLAGNLFVALSNLLADQPCVTYQTDMKVKVSESIYYYPDLLVTCEGIEDDAYVSEQPVLIVEVLSRTTRRTDRREKLKEYQKMPSVRECVLISQGRVAIEVYRREQVDEQWQVQIYTNLQDEISFASIGVQVKVADIYRRVKIAAVTPEVEPKEEETKEAESE